MAATSLGGQDSKLVSRHLSSEEFVESCGAILFDLTDPDNLSVCLIRTQKEWLLAKGRRNYGETRQDAAIREVIEETGFRCSLFPVTMPTRATPPEAPAVGYPDKARVFDNLIEPFSCEIRECRKPIRTKFIYWYIAALDVGAQKLPGEPHYKPKFIPVQQAIQTLTFEADRRLVAKAAGLVSITLKGGSDQWAISTPSDAGIGMSTNDEAADGQITGEHPLRIGNPIGVRAPQDPKAAKQSGKGKKGIKGKCNRAQNPNSNGATAIPTAAAATTPSNGEAASHPNNGQPPGSNNSSKKKPKNCTAEELTAFRKWKKERIKAKRLARGTEQQ
ncbi:hypothetical protein DM02DRAFT_647802 [Periconia macrospinosa]|uniref:Nudix hydrolase domain-containing protein n=1 Tax=Periconia macrospinosa TaxID=97972 RepID=A0A2V1ECT4_9PLEO|nr:hypothetical protein DM02DRAFT_647802 [Periconia macrospinosa]